MIMLFDTETNGLPPDWKAPMKQLDNWPRVIQLAWRVTDEFGATLHEGDWLIRPDGWTIPDGSNPKETFWKDHGFSTELSAAHGKPLHQALAAFVQDLQQCSYLVSHNMDFDYNVTGAEMLRLGLSSDRRPVRICTKELSTDICKIPFQGARRYPGSRQSFKWPKLEELHRFLFGRDFEDAHDAGGDVAALAACFFELKARGYIRLQEGPTP